MRIVKTKKSINSAMFALLERHNFRKITVKDICEEALISRATFYSHFDDKYDLLRYWLLSLAPGSPGSHVAYESMEAAVNGFIQLNKQIIKNIVEGADYETLDIVFDFVLTSLSLSGYGDKRDTPEHIVFTNVFAGGLVCYLLWHIRNRFPFDVMNEYLRGIIENFQQWQAL